MTLRSQKGFSLLEALVTIAITSMITFAVASLQKDIITIDSALRGSFAGQTDARKVFKSFEAEMRVAAYAGNGAYPLVSAAATSITFYSDVAGDGAVERYRYFLSGTDLKKGVIQPSGNPVVYTGTETITTVAKDMANGASPIFEYFNAAYDGTTAALTQPVTASQVRLVRIRLILDKNGTRPPEAQTYVTEVSLRNLKDNL